MTRSGPARRLRMLTLITPSEAPWSAESGEPFTKYTMPALELRRFLHELRRAGEAFELTYTRLDAAEDARLRPSTATGTTVRLREDGSGGRSVTHCYTYRRTSDARCRRTATASRRAAAVYHRRYPAGVAARCHAAAAAVACRRRCPAGGARECKHQGV